MEGQEQITREKEQIIREMEEQIAKAVALLENFGYTVSMKSAQKKDSKYYEMQKAFQAARTGIETDKTYRDSPEHKQRIESAMDKIFSKNVGGNKRSYKKRSYKKRSYKKRSYKKRGFIM
jgi:hypothetical protein